MQPIIDWFNLTAQDPIFNVVYLLLLLSFVNFGIGSVKAGAGGFFNAASWKAWIASDSGTVLPIVFALLAAKALSGVVIVGDDNSPVTAGGLFGSYALVQALTAVVAYGAKIRDKLAPNPVALQRKEELAEAAGTDIPPT